MNAPSTEKTRTIVAETKPFLKWAGGKQQLLPQFEAHFPPDFNRYFEPFVGGAAVFFHLWNTGRLPEQVFLSDNNEELVNAYRVVRDELDTLVALLETHRQNHNEAYYYQIRSLDRQDVELTDAEKAARLIYMNRTCYNGLYRVNSKKQFNVPIGRYKNPSIVRQDVLEAASAALQGVDIQVRGFREIVELARPGDFFYFDPPYDPVSKTANFTSYTAHAFGDQDQRDLAEVFTQLAQKGCLCMLSNSHTDFIHALYEAHTVEIVYARRRVNSDVNGRGEVKEVVVKNY